ncbi:Predicted methyltransferase [Plasmopara halstedii]|uniref:Predicted methyltransferase n=1 Tax=Plasmopara halstedii TaxID=4781 RepID=A0A0P1ANA5_PLAHL|nr:Predicted methyltransferase [Plasmopara halstedii]CEG42734.1 Predicted methyltransferase [Plasmopara halstedii]|eukprot:XP_024579103.1 Predicted methyltransferase [Plasmopara halstedii]
MELQRVIEAYRAMEPVRDVIALIKTKFAVNKRWASLDFQAQIVELVIKDAVCEDFSPLRRYTYSFLKKFVDEIESVNGSLDDELVETLMNYVLSVKVSEDTLNAEAMHYVSYTIPKTEASIIVTCRVASVMNDVGLKIWEAGWLLAEYIIAHKSEFKDRKVLELGSGVGFTGMVLACVCHARHIVLTDYAPSVMQNLRYNVELNMSKFICPIQVQMLEWESWHPQEADDEKPDILLAGDCVYDIAAFPHLMRVLQLFFGNDEGVQTSNTQRMAIFAATIRNQKTFQEFLNQLAAHYIEYVDITASSLVKMGTPLFPYPIRDQIRLCRLSRASVRN